MEIADKYKNILQRAVFSCEHFTTGYSVMLLLFFVPYAAAHCNIIALAFLPVVIILPFAVMPILYSLLHRIDMLLFGRYHLAMPLASLLASLFFVFIWCCGDASSAWGSVALVFGALIFSISVILQRYCAFSVRARLQGGMLKPDLASVCFSALGGIAAVVCVCCFRFYNEKTMYINSAYVLSAACVILALLQYLSTSYGIPRLGGKRVQSVKSVFRAFYTGLNKRMYFSSALFLGAFMTLAALVVYFAVVSSSNVSMPATVSAVLAATYFGGSVFCDKKIKRRSKLLSVTIFLCVLFAAVLMSVTVPVSLGKGGDVCMGIAAALIGIGGAVSRQQSRLRFMSIKNRVTSGTVFIMLELVQIVAAAFALVVAIVVLSLGGVIARYAFICGFGLAVVFAAAAFAVAGKKSYKNERIPELSFELKTEELERLSLSAKTVNSDDQSETR